MTQARTSSQKETFANLVLALTINPDHLPSSTARGSELPPRLEANLL